jgi:hypothetical protein
MNSAVPSRAEPVDIVLSFLIVILLMNALFGYVAHNFTTFTSSLPIIIVHAGDSDTAQIC